MQCQAVHAAAMASSFIPSPGISFEGTRAKADRSRAPRPLEAGISASAALISNPRSHRNKGARATSFDGGPRHVSPSTLSELEDAIAQFAAEKVKLLIIDGGDGTIRDVLTAGYDIWKGDPPRLLVLPSGKTNALANDLRIPSRLEIGHSLRFAVQSHIERRAPIEVRGAGLGCTVLRGFVFGAGAFVDAIALAQRTHRAGAFAGLAVGLTLAWSIGRTLWGSQGSNWADGAEMAVSYGADSVPLHGRVPDGQRDGYLLLASTLNRLPLGLRPFGRERPGMKTLLIDAPPLAVPTSVPRLLLGSHAPSLETSGYHRVDTDQMHLDMPAGFVLDGEYYPGGTYVLSRGEPLEFLVS